MKMTVDECLVSRVGVAVLLAAVTLSAQAAVQFELQHSGTTTAFADDVNAFDLLATNTGSQAIDLAGITLGLQILPQGLATGSATITAVAPAGAGSPWINPGTTGPTAATLVNGSVNGSSGYYQFSVSENDLEQFGTVAIGSSVNLAAVTVTTSADTRGLWGLFAVTEMDDLGNVVSSFSDPDFNTYQFSNLTAPPYPGAGSAMQIRTIQYVPEPSATAQVIAGAGALISLVASCWRRRAGCRRPVQRLA